MLIGNIYLLKDDSTHVIYISLINLEEESTVKNSSYQIRQNGAACYQSSPVYLVLYLLLGANLFFVYSLDLVHERSRQIFRVDRAILSDLMFTISKML